MSDPIHEALKHHTKEPEEVDWEAECAGMEKSRDFWREKTHFFLSCMRRKNKEITRLKDTILRLEQRCAKAEGRDGPDKCACGCGQTIDSGVRVAWRPETGQYFVFGHHPRKAKKNG